MNKCKIEVFSNRVITLLTAGFVFTALILSLIFFKNGYALLSVVFAVLLFLTFYFAFRLIDGLDKNKIFVLTAVLFSVFLGLEAVSIIFLKSSAYTDSFRCIDTAISFIQDENLTVDETHKHYNYFSMYSNNNFFVMVLYLFFKIVGIKEPVLSVKILNAFLMLLSVILTWICVKVLKGERTAVKLLSLCVFNPCFYVAIHWCYTLTFSLPIMSATVVAFLYFQKAKSLTKKIILAGVEGLLTTVGFLLRPTSVFPMIAIIFVSLFKLKFNKTFLRKFGVCFLSFILTLCLSFSCISAYSNKRFKTNPEDAFPVTHWVMMGLSETGCYNSRDVRMTMNKAETKKEKTELNKKVIVNRLKNKNFSKHYLNKVNNTFALGTYAFGGRIGHTNIDGSLNSYISGENSAVFIVYSQGYKILMYLTILICLFFVFKNNDKKLIPFVITVFGAFVFYMLWESKQIYSFAFIGFFLILSACGFEKIPSLNLKGKLRFVFVLPMISVIVLSAYLLNNAPNSRKPVIINSFVGDSIVESVSNNEEISQEFYLKSSFSKITVFSDTFNKKPDISVQDEFGNDIFIKKIRVKKSKNNTEAYYKVRKSDMNRYTIYLKEYTPKGNERFRIILKNGSYYVNDTYGIKHFSGKFSVRGKEENKNLVMTVS